MRRIPKKAFDDISYHINSACPRAERGWQFGNQDEDTLTGDFLGNLRSGLTNSGNTSWEFSYNKVRGRGPNALEKTIGADGIITLHLKNQKTGTELYKSLVFQSKKIGNNTSESQISKMNKFFPGGNSLFTYGPNGYYATDSAGNEQRICQLIITKFLACHIGIKGLYYDHMQNKFIKPHSLNVHLDITHELLIDVFIQ